MASLISWLGERIHDLATDDEQQRNLRRSQQSLRVANRKIQRGQGFKYGKLARPQARTQFVRQNRVPEYNPAQITRQAIRSTFTDPKSFNKAPKINIGNFRGSGIIEEFINSPFGQAQGLVNIGQGNIKKGAGQFAKATIEGPAGFLPVGRVAQVGLKARALAPAIKAGAKQGAKEGAVYGGAYGAGQAASQEGSIEDIIKGGAIGAVTGGVGGAVLGGAVPVGVAGVKAVGRAKPVRELAQAQAGAVKVPRRIQRPDAPVNVKMSTLAEAERTRYKPTVTGKARNKVASSFDPYSELVKIDKRYAKSKGMKYRDLPATERLDFLADKTAYSAKQAEDIIRTPTRTGLSGEDIIKKYGEGTPGGKEFNNYTNAKFDLEFRAKHKGKPIQAQYTTDELARFVQDYELRNPQAITDGATKKAINDQAIDIMVDAGAISRKEGDFVKSFYDNAVPLSRVVAEDLKRIELGGKSVGSIGRQSVLQKLEGNSGIPLDDSFTPLVDRINKAVNQANRAKLAKKVLQRSREGTVPNSRLLVGAGNKATRKTIRTDIKTVNRSTKMFTKKLGLTLRQTKKLETEINNLNKKGLHISLKKPGIQPNKITPSGLGGRVSTGKAGQIVPMTKIEKRILKAQGTTNVEVPTYASKLGAKDTQSVVKTLVDMPDKQILSIQKKIANREPKLASKLDDIRAYKVEVETNKELKGSLKEVIAQFDDASTKGRQTISGYIEGEPFKLEVSPELGRALQGLDEQRLNVVLRGMKVPIKIFQTAWTGFLNPVFSGISFALYDTPMTVINSKLGFRTFGARAIGESLRSFNSNSAFQRRLARAGAQTIGGSQLPADVSRSAEAIAARKNIFSKIKFNAKNPSEALRSLDIIGGKLANSTRTRVAKAHYINATKKGMSPEQAIAEAAYYYNNVLPNYGRTSNLARQLNSAIPYVGASAAGTRALASALRNNPYAAVKLAGVGIAPMVGTAAYSLGSEEGREFFKDMIDSKKQYILDNNFVVVLPGASKNPKTGEWSGVLKIPVSPELRALNQIAWRQVDQFSKNIDKSNPARVALSLFDFSTGGIRSQENPLTDTLRIAAGLDPRSSLTSNNPLVKGAIADKPKSQQVYDSTSNIAKTLSDITGNKLSPIQVDSILSQFSTGGQLLQNRRGTPLKTLAGTVQSRFTSAFGKTEGAKFYEAFEKYNSQIKNSDDKRAFEFLHEEDAQPGILDSAEKAQIYLNRPAVLKAERKLDQWSRKQGKLGNPLFDLTPLQLKKVLVYRQNKMANNGKQNYDKSGNPMFTSLGLDEPWYDKFRNQETKFYNKIAKKDKKSDERTFSGATRPKLTPNQEKLQNQYFNLPKGQKSAFLDANPWLLKYWDSSDGFANKERVAIGLKKLEKDSGFGGFGRSGGGYGGSSGYSPSIIKTASYVDTKAPKGVKVRKLPVPKAPAPKKIRVAKIKSNYLNRKLS